MVKYEVTKMRDILSQAQKYMQIKNATRGKTRHSPKWGNEGRNRNHSLFARRRIKIKTSEP